MQRPEAGTRLRELKPETGSVPLKCNEHEGYGRARVLGLDPSCSGRALERLEQDKAMV